MSYSSFGIVFLVLLASLLTACSSTHSSTSFSNDVAYLKKHRDTIVLASPDGQAKVAIVPSICARVFTSTATGDDGTSYGYLNRDVLASKTILPKINGYGGEDRFWLGPEGGQFAIFFKPGDKFTLDDWQTPAPIDTEPYRVVSQTPTSVTMTHDASFKNVSGTTLNVKIDRTVRLVDAAAACKDLGIAKGKTSCVAFETDNAITNTGSNAWTKDSGMLSIWTLGMFKPSPKATAVIPFVQGSESTLGPIVKDDYFGKVPASRLKVGDKAIFFKADGIQRTKIGTSPRRSKGMCGSWDPSLNVLTIITFSQPASVTSYVNSMWETQKEPFAGDTINSYNDVGTPDHKPTFYELETSSPALPLQPGQRGTHLSRTIHFTGPRADLDAIATKTLGVSLDNIEQALP